MPFNPLFSHFSALKMKHHTSMVAKKKIAQIALFCVDGLVIITLISIMLYSIGTILKA
jgi:hypothetical protein